MDLRLKSSFSLEVLQADPCPGPAPKEAMFLEILWAPLGTWDQSWLGVQAGYPRTRADPQILCVPRL